MHTGTFYSYSCCQFMSRMIIQLVQIIQKQTAHVIKTRQLCIHKLTSQALRQDQGLSP